MSRTAAAVCLMLVAAIVLMPEFASAQNPIVVENQQPGTNAWLITGNTGSDSVGQIKAYMSATSVNKGGSITFYVSVNPAQTYTIDVYRLGWYQGLGGRLMQHIGGLNGIQQPTCPVNSTTGMIECQWSAGYTLQTQTTWTSGVYLAVLTNSQNYQNYTHFVVRDDSRTAALLYQLPDNTYQAYNDYPYDQRTGKSLYSFDSYGANTVGGTTAAVKVSFDRPYNYDGDCGVWGYCVLAADTAFIHWLEKNGYDVTYSSDVDSHANGGQLLNYKGVISGVHNEYWSKPMYDNFTAALNSGVSLFFSSANAIYWQVRYESSSSGVPNRVLVCYRDANLDPNPDPTLKTINWRDPPLNRPEQTLIGVMYTNIVSQISGGTYPPYVVQNSSNWVYAGTGFKDGDSVPGVTGYEADRQISTYPLPNTVPGTYVLLSHSPYNASGTSDYQSASIYQAPSGGWVFASGTVNWANTLDGFSPSGTNIVDSRLQQVTANVLNRFISGAPVGDFSLSASPSSRTVTPGYPASYGITITPSGGFTNQVTLSVSGLPSGATASFSPNPAGSSSTLAITTGTSTPPGTYPLTVTGISSTLSHTTTLTLVVSSTPDFLLSASPSNQTVVEGGSTSYTATVTLTNGLSTGATLSVTGLPTGATGTFSPNPASGTSTLSVTTTTSTPPGSYPLTITGTDAGQTHTAGVTLIVSQPDFSLAVTPSNQTAVQGRSTTYTATVTPLLGFAGQVSLSVSGLPTGATGSFSPNPASSTSTLTVTAGTTTPAGAYTLTVNGTSGALSHTATTTLTVAPAGVAFDNAISSGIDFGITKLTTAAFVVGTGPNRAAMIMLAMSANTATNITASLGGVAGTLIPGTDSAKTATARTLIFQVVNPPSGAQTATVSWTGAMNADMGVITVTGADQTTPTNNGTFSASTSAPAAGTSVTISSNPGDLTASVGYSENDWKSPYTNQTRKWGIDSGSVGGDIGPGTGTTTHTWTDDYAGQTHAVSGANFRTASQPNFTVAASPSSQSVNQGVGTSYSVTVSQLNGFSDAVTLSVSGLPTGATGTFSPNPTTGSSTLSLTTDPVNTPTGSYPLTITGSADGLTHTASVTLVVTAPDFTLTAGPASQTVSQGNSASYTATINPVNGFNGQVTLSASGLPTGANATFTPNPASSTSAVSITTDGTTPGGTYTITLTGQSGSLTHTTTVTMVVNVPDFTLSAGPASQSVSQGNAASYTATITPANGFTGQVTLSASGLPTGAAASFTPNPATTTSSVSITTDTTTPSGSYTITLTGQSGSLTHSTTVTLVVSQPDYSLSATPSSQTGSPVSPANYTVNINPIAGFTGQVTLGASGMPAGATANFGTNPATSSSSLAITPASGTTPGSYTVTITGASGTLSHTTTVTLVVPTPDFSLSPSPTSQTVVQGNPTSYTLTVNPTNGFTGQATFSVSGLPTGATGTFGPNPSGTTSTLSVTTATTTPTGSYTLTVTGVSGTLSHTTTVTLVVNAAPDFTLAESPASQTVAQGGSTTYGTTITGTNGFSGQVTLSVSGLPAGANGNFSVNPATTTSTLTVTTDPAATPVGTYTLTITGTSGSLTHTKTVTLVVSTPDYTLSASPTTLSITQGASGTSTITINPTLGFNGQVTLSVAGLPTGATGTFSVNPATTTSVLTVATAATTPAGTSTLTITGTSGTLTHTTTISLTVKVAGVAFDSKVSSKFNFGVTSITTPAFTIGTGTNRAAVIMVAMANNNATNITASLGGVAATLVPGTDSGTASTMRTLIFQVINPPSGSKTATVSWTTAMNADVGVIVVTGADQTTPVINGTFGAFPSNSTNKASVTITSNPGDLTASIGYTSNAWKSPYTNRTLKFGIDNTEVGGDIGPGTGTTVHTWTDNYAGQSEVVSGVNFKAAAH